MFCNQCEQTAHGTGCTNGRGVCGFEQKAVAVLLTLLSLGVKGISVGPKPPAFVTPNVFAILQDKFDLRLTGDDAKADLAAAIT